MISVNFENYDVLENLNNNQYQFMYFKYIKIGYDHDNYEY